jgi:hypothetical protein
MSFETPVTLCPRIQEGLTKHRRHCCGSLTTEMGKRATSSIPLVTALVLDPVGSGLVQSLSHPGGNVTGLMTTVALNSKRLQLLKEVIPQLASCSGHVESRLPATCQGGRRTISPQNCAGWHRSHGGRNSGRVATGEPYGANRVRNDD